MPAWKGFIGGSNTLPSVTADNERTVNLYVEQAQAQGAKNQAALYGTPGFRMWSTVADAGGRALAKADGRLFAVIGSGLYEFSTTGVATKHGTVGQDAHKAFLIYNGKVGGQLGIASAGSVYTFDMATNVLAGPHFGTATITMLAYADGYGLGFDANTGRVYLSALNDLSSWSAGTFFQRSKFPDPWRAMFVDSNSLIWMVGDETFEVWYDANPSSTQPWAPLSGLTGQFGIASPFAYGVGPSGLYWLSTGRSGGAQIVQTAGSKPQGVSTYAVNAALSNYRRTTTISDAECFVYEDSGHEFVNFSFPRATATWTLDAGPRSWAERGQWVSANNRYELWAPRVHADFEGKHLALDRISGTVWEMSTALHTDIDGQGLRRLRRAPALDTEHHRVPIDQVELIMDVGVGLVSGQGSDPQALLRISDDGGTTFGNERRAGMGAIGKTRQRVYWNRLGAPADACIEVVWTDPVPSRVVNALINNMDQAA